MEHRRPASRPALADLLDYSELDLTTKSLKHKAIILLVLS